MIYLRVGLEHAARTGLEQKAPEEQYAQNYQHGDDENLYERHCGILVGKRPDCKGF